MSQGIVVTLPPLPLTECLLFAIAFVLWRIMLQMSEGILILRELRSSLRQQESAKDGGQHKALAGGDELSNDLARRGGALSPGSRRRSLTPAPDESPPAIERMLNDSAQLFAESLLDEDDVDVAKFIKACRHYTRVLEKIGPFTMLSVRETQSNITKIEQTYLLDPARFRSMINMLEEEVSSRMHSPGGVLADPSAAIGLLWARRGLAFWISIFRPHVAEYRARNTELKDLDMEELELDAKSSVGSGGTSSPAASSAAHAASRLPSIPSGNTLSSEPPGTSPGSSRARGLSSSATSLDARVLRSRSTTPPASWADQADGLFRDGAASAAEKMSTVASDLADRMSGAGAKLLSGVVSEQGYAEFLRAYEETIAPFNGWIARNTFTLTARASPDWDSFWPKVAPQPQPQPSHSPSPSPSPSH